MAFASVLVGLLVASVALIAVGAYGAIAYGLAAKLVKEIRKTRPKLRLRRDDARRLSVTEIASRRREAKMNEPTGDEAPGAAEPPTALQIAPTADTPQIERVVPLRTRAFR